MNGEKKQTEVIFNETNIAKHRELYDDISRVLTWYENPDEYPFDEDSFNKHIAEEMYNVLVEVQNQMFYA